MAREQPQSKNQLRTLRQGRELSIWALATLCGVSPTTITAVEKYGHECSIEVKQKIANGLGLSISAVWPGDSTMREA